MTPQEAINKAVNIGEIMGQEPGSLWVLCLALMVMLEELIEIISYREAK